MFIENTFFQKLFWIFDSFPCIERCIPTIGFCGLVNTHDSCVSLYLCLYYTLFCRRIPPRLLWLNETFGALSILFQHMSFHSSLCIAINRFLAITFPVLYRNFFTTRFSLLLVVFIIVYSLAYWAVFFFGRSQQLLRKSGFRQLQVLLRRYDYNLAVFFQSLRTDD